MEVDSDLAYNLQLEEALNASRLYAASEAEVKRWQLDLSIQIHDRSLACEILSMPEDKWCEIGNNLNRPYGEGSSSSSNQQQACGFRSNQQFFGCRVYVKGLIDGLAGGIGVAICDSNGNLLFELGKTFSGEDRQWNALCVEMKALIEGLSIAVMLGLNRVTILTDNNLLYLHIFREFEIMVKSNVATLSDEIKLLLRKLTQPCATLVPEKDLELASAIARNAMAFNVNRISCSLCFEDTYMNQMFQISYCLHSYCVSCMLKHVEFKLLQGTLPRCPHVYCNSELKLDSCKKFLTSELSDLMNQRLKEASIPVEERIYCPYPTCSTLLSITELQTFVGSSDFVDDELGARKCPKCSGIFCVKCKVPWHGNMSCRDFLRLNPIPREEEDNKLKSLATQNLWRQCPKCNHMVSLAEGCYHITCRCRHEFCYTCGAEWKNRRSSCTCPLWDERNIVYDRRNPIPRR
ncbi:hypothetical protein ACP275_14G254800 [Erythranthe tilingii]